MILTLTSLPAFIFCQDVVTFSKLQFGRLAGCWGTRTFQGSYRAESAFWKLHSGHTSLGLHLLCKVALLILRFLPPPRSCAASQLTASLIQIPNSHLWAVVQLHLDEAKEEKVIHTLLQEWLCYLEYKPQRFIILFFRRIFYQLSNPTAMPAIWLAHPVRLALRSDVKVSATLILKSRFGVQQAHALALVA